MDLLKNTKVNLIIRVINCLVYYLLLLVTLGVFIINILKVNEVLEDK